MAYLAQLLLGRGYRVYGVLACRSSDILCPLRQLKVLEDVDLSKGDITALFSMIRLVAQSQPRDIYNICR